MAADVTLLALPASAANWRTAETAVYRVLLPGDEAWVFDGRREQTVRCVDDGQVTGPDGPVDWPPSYPRQLTAIVSGGAREQFWKTLYDKTEYLEIGPAVPFDYRPHPTMGAGEFWLMPRVISPVAVTDTMVRMNVSDRSPYRDWQKPRPREVRRWLTERLGWIAWSECV
jgi:hypothetical protein